jgi:hypothetical protein
VRVLVGAVALLFAPRASAVEAEFRALQTQGKQYYENKQFGRAAEVSRALVAEAERTFGAEHENTLQSKSYIGLSLSANLQHEEAIGVNWVSHCFAFHIRRRVQPGRIFSKVCRLRESLATIDSTVAVETKGFGS